MQIDPQVIQSHLLKLVRERNLAVNALTETQLAEALRQALAAGDFVRYVRVDDDSQQVVYTPYREVERLRARVQELERELTENMEDACKYRDLLD